MNKMNVIFNYIIQFVLGGGIIVGMDILAKNFNPKYASILYALPLQFTLAIIFIYLDSKEGTVAQLAYNSLFYTLGFVIFIVVFYLLIKYLSFWLSLGLSYSLFIIISLIIYRFL